MISQLKQAIKDLKTQVLTAKLAGSTDACFLFTSLNNNHVKLEQEGLTFDIPKPACLMEIINEMEGVECLGGHITVSEGLVFKFSAIHEQLNAPSDGSVNYGMDENLDVFDYRDALKRCLTGFIATNCSALQYKGENQDYSHNNVYIYSLLMKCSYVDTKGSILDVDSGAIYAQPPFNLDLDTYFTTPAGPQTHQAYGWKACTMQIVIVNAPAYASGTTYALGDTVTYSGKIYQSLVNSNTGHQPDTSPTKWVAPTQTLTNANPITDGDVVPVLYALNMDGTLTIPELVSYPGITVQTPFMMGNDGYNTTGTFNFGFYGGFSAGMNIEINVVLPLYTAL